jgi:hypothetical protein
VADVMVFARGLSDGEVALLGELTAKGVAR